MDYYGILMDPVAAAQIFQTFPPIPLLYFVCEL